MKRLYLAISFLLVSSLSYASELTEVLCVLAPSQDEKVQELTKFLATSTGSTHFVLISNQLDIRKHSSGKSILANARSRYIPGTISGATLTRRVVTVGIVGLGMATIVELGCIPENHPEVLTFLNQDNGYSIDFQNKMYAAVEKNGYVEKSKFDKIADRLKEFKYVTEDKFYELIGETWYERTARKTRRFFSD